MSRNPRNSGGQFPGQHPVRDTKTDAGNGLKTSIANLNDIARNLLQTTPPEVVEANVRITGGAAAATFLISEIIQSAYGIHPDEVVAYLILSGVTREFERLGLAPLAQQLMAEEAKP